MEAHVAVAGGSQYSELPRPHLTGRRSVSGVLTNSPPHLCHSTSQLCMGR